MKDKNQNIQFDFDYWANIAKVDPDRFESMREAILEDLIEQSPSHMRRRMEGLQWQINQIRITSSNPMASCLRISQLMWNSVLGDQGLITALQTPEKILNIDNQGITGKVIPLKSPGKFDES